uniref:Venom peptide Sh42 n=1 Tax=Isodontia harmandi TaxID=2838365 RepID=VP42_ISOHA|nr:RecName: Full=Venom peptide Sh42 [Isodontia harmandi]
EDDLSDFNPKV